MDRELVERLRALQAAATPGPYRAHDHMDMAKLGEDPEKWIGYGWVGRIGKDSTPDGRWDAGWLDADRRKDACKEYRARASADVHFVAEALNALPALLTLIESQASQLSALRQDAEGMAEALMKARKLAVAAIETNITGIDFDPAEHPVVQQIDTALSKYRGEGL